MDHKKAVQVALASMQAEARQLAVSANLHERYGLDSPYNIAASKRRAELREAIKTLKAQPRLL